MTHIISSSALAGFLEEILILPWYFSSWTRCYCRSTISKRNKCDLMMGRTILHTQCTSKAHAIHTQCRVKLGAVAWVANRCQNVRGKVLVKELLLEMLLKFKLVNYYFNIRWNLFGSLAKHYASVSTVFYTCNCNSSPLNCHQAVRVSVKRYLMGIFILFSFLQYLLNITIIHIAYPPSIYAGI